MSTKDKDRKRSNVEDSPTKKVEPKRAKTEEVKAKAITDAELFNIEVEESKHRDKTADLNAFKNAVAAIKESLDVIRDLKTKNDPDSSAEILEQRIFTSLAIARLRKLNRMAHLGSAKSKDTTSEKRNKNDQYHLVLQNLQYEVGHLQKEINKCLEFRSKDEELSLVPVDSFYSHAPAEISRPEITKEDLHEQRKARLQWELEQRKMLAKQLTETKLQIEKSQADIQTRESNLESLAPKLNKILEATRPVQEYLGMPFEQQKEQFQLARYLPQPLFVLYRNLNALETQDKKGHLQAFIEGDADAAKTFIMQTTAKGKLDEESDSDQEDETTHKASKHRRRMTSIHEEDAESKVLKSHPLHVSLTLLCSKSEQTISPKVKVQLSFHYMTTMNMVTVKGSLTESISVSSVDAGDLMEIGKILGCLCHGDKGDQNPTSFSQSQLDKLTPSNIDHYKPRIGIPFKWAQTISGLNTLSADITEPKLASVVSLIKKIKKLVLDRVELVHQLTDLERCNLAVPVMSTEILPCHLPTTSLHHWSRSTYEDVCALSYATEYIETGAITPDCTIYMAKLACINMKIIVYISISGDYPATRPIVIVRVEDPKLGILTRDNNDSVSCIEQEVNLGKYDLTEAIPNQLNLQIIRLAWCCDVLAAVLSFGTSQQSMVNIKFIPNIHRGRDRQLPLTYNSETGFFGHD